jgi:hypothetical protein
MTNLSMAALELEAIPISDEFELIPSEPDSKAWPFLAKEVLAPQRDYGELDRFMKAMSIEEIWSYRLIIQKPEEEWTRLGRKFMREMHTRDLGVTCLSTALIYRDGSPNR